MTNYPLIMTLAVSTVAGDLPNASESTPSIQHALTSIYVRRDEALPPTVVNPLILVGEYDIVTSSGSILIIEVEDLRTPTIDLRTARTEYDLPIAANTTYQIKSDIIIDN